MDEAVPVVTRLGAVGADLRQTMWMAPLSTRFIVEAPTHGHAMARLGEGAHKGLQGKTCHPACLVGGREPTPKLLAEQSSFLVDNVIYENTIWVLIINRYCRNVVH